jgi:Tfp pilus assembly PilM family ATPase
MVNTIVALDIGSTHLRGIEAQIKTGQTPKIIKIHSMPLESLVVESGLIKNEALLQSSIKKFWIEAKFSSKTVIAMATGDAYDNRVVPDIPWSPPADFKRLLPHYLKERLPFDVEDYYFDAHTLNEYYKEDPNDKQLYKLILVAGVHREFTDTLIKVIEGAGLRPAGIDIMPLSLIRSYSLLSEAPENATVVSVELGGDITTIVIHKNNQPVYINTATPLGGTRITAMMAQELAITIPEAEILKVSFSLPPEERAELIATNFYEDGSTRQTTYSNFTEAQKANALNIISREVSNIIIHIGDILEDAFSSKVETPFELVLSGGGAGLYSLISRVQSELGITVRVSQPFGDEASSKIDPNVFINQHAYSSIFGLLVGQDEL